MSSRFSLNHAGTAIVLTALLMASCAPQVSPPRQIKSSNPSITYNYRGDQELLKANQSAMTFCNQYHSAARTLNIVDDSDGSKTVNFECVSMADVTIPPQSFSPNYAYTYRADQELLDASRNAEIYCMNNGARAMSNTVTDAYGTKTVTFQCVR